MSPRVVIGGWVTALSSGGLGVALVVQAAVPVGLSGAGPARGSALGVGLGGDGLGLGSAAQAVRSWVLTAQGRNRVSAAPVGAEPSARAHSSR